MTESEVIQHQKGANMKTLVKLNRRPLCGGQKFTYVLRYKDENGK